MRQRAATLALTIAAALAVPALASPRVLLYAAGDTEQLRAAQRGVREALGPTPTVEIRADDTGDRLRAAAREDPDTAIIAFGPEAAARAAREAPGLATVDCMSTQAGASAKAVPTAIPLAQQLAWLKRLLPSARYIGVLYDPAQNAELVGALAAALRAADLNPVLAPVATPALLPPALARLSTSADALLAVPDTTVYTRATAKGLLLFSFRHKLPLIGLSESWVHAGALYAVDWDYRELGAFCARLALGQLTGAQTPAPVQPQLHIYVNERSARRFRVQWDDSVRQSFDRVVE